MREKNYIEHLLKDGSYNLYKVWDKSKDGYCDYKYYSSYDFYELIDKVETKSERIARKKAEIRNKKIDSILS